MKVGVLALQGAFAEMANAFRRTGAETFEIRSAADIARPFDALALPGGESTAQRRLLDSTGLFAPLRDRIAAGLPVFATCAGLILLAREVEDGAPCFGALDVTVRRNAYGTQLDSFTVSGPCAGFDGVKMIGFWDEELPVSSGREDVKAAVYESKNGDLLICFASFADQPVRFTPSGGPFDDPGRGEVFLPRVEGLQERADYSGGELELAPSTGVILWARGKAQMNDAPETK